MQLLFHRYHAIIFAVSFIINDKTIKKKTNEQ